MVDFTSVSSIGWGGRLMESIKGVLVGIVLFFASIVLLFWNEGRAVDRAKVLAESEGAAISVPSESVDAGKEGMLVHLTGQAVTSETLTDEAFGIEAPALRMKRATEMFQWREHEKKETKKKLGGGEERVTTYSYNKEWADHHIDSSKFHQSGEFTNPPAMKVESNTVNAQKITVGAFTLAPGLVSQLSQFDKLGLDKPPPRLPGGLEADQVKLVGGDLYLGKDPNQPEVGDTRVRFEIAKPAEVTVLARQVKDTFEVFPTTTGSSLEMTLKYGTHSIESIFGEKVRANTAMTWGLRFFGWILMAIGISLVFRPFVVLASVIPFLGDLLGLGVALFAGLISAFVSLTTIAIAWFFYRPLLSIVLIAVGVGLVVLLKKIGGKAHDAADNANGPGGEAPPPPNPTAA